MTFQAVADLPLAGTVYAEGWQTWSRVGVYRAGETSPRAPDERAQIVEWRPGKPVPPGVIQAEGVLAVESPDGAATAWFSPDPAREVATLRLAARRDRFELRSDGPVATLHGDGLVATLAAVGHRLGPGPVRIIPSGWCSWSYYFKNVTEDDVVENAEAARRLALPIEIVQVDDGYEADIGDWLDVRREFGSLRRLAERIRATGMRPGIWIAPFMVGPRSKLAMEHPDWLVAEAGAGRHWGKEMRILDVGQPGAADYIANVFETFSRWGFDYFKLDFLYAAAIPGLDVYRQAMQLIRRAVGEEAILLAGGAPLLPSIGLCDAMRIGPDVLPEVPHPQLEIDNVVRITRLRSWMNGRLWINDPDCIVARPEIAEREAWAAHLMDYGGLRFSSDRLASLDARGLELTRRFLRG
ncbi:MAG TPA: glycoside hydrolase family 36 protein [Candidatus Limnocylindrales bacterium]|nr:glycoside hydrolase family 36 protein [Candidatus Limnocylindrales bacterium]